MKRKKYSLYNRLWKEEKIKEIYKESKDKNRKERKNYYRLMKER